MQKTSNYNLKKPEPNDPLRVEDFNENADIIDGVLDTLNTAVPKIAAGSYTGNGAASRTINLGFTPKAVLVVNAYGQMYSSKYYNGGLAVAGNPVVMDDYTVVEIVADGFCVYQNTTVSSNSYVVANSNAVKYHYLAIG